MPHVDMLSIDQPAKVEALPNVKAPQASPKAAEVHVHASATGLQQPLHRPLSIDSAWARAHSSPQHGHAVQTADPSTLQEYLPNRAFTEPQRASLGVSALDSPISQLRTNPSGEWRFFDASVCVTGNPLLREINLHLRVRSLDGFDACRRAP